MSLLNGIGQALAAFQPPPDMLTKSLGLDQPQPQTTPADQTVTPQQSTQTQAPAPVAPPQTSGILNAYSGPRAQVLAAAEKSLLGHESGGQANAQNQVSSAGGLYQIIDSTWDSAMKQLGVPVAATQAERNAQKYDPALNTAAMKLLNVSYAAALDKANLPVTVNTLQALHRLGVSGGITAIHTAIQDPNAPLVGNGLSPDAVRGNGDVSGLTVSQFLATPYGTRGA